MGFNQVEGQMPPVRATMWGIRGLLFVTLNVFLVGFYCFAMSGKLEPLKFHPTRFVTLPLMVITAVIAVFLYPLLWRQSLRLDQDVRLFVRALTLYLGFVLIAAIYGVYLWILFPDGSIFSVLLAVVGGHLYGWPVFLAVLVTQLLFGRLLFPVPISELPGREPASSHQGS